MINKYIIYSRYEYLGKKGKQWTNWFKTGKFHNTEESANIELKGIKEISNSIDKITKLKHQYEIRYIDIETLPMPTLHYGKKGRPSKKDIEDLKNKKENYWKQYDC